MLAKELIKLAEASLVSTRNQYRYKTPEIMDICIKSLARLQACRLLVDLLGFSLVECGNVVKAIKEENMTFAEACNKYL